MRQPSPTRVLYLGPDPERAPAPRYAEDPEQARAMIRKRPASFEQLLKQHFMTVTVVTPDGYDESLSADHDVTIFDACPNRTGTREIQGHELPALLSEGFDRPSVMIGANTWRMIGRVGLNYKLDHL